VDIRGHGTHFREGFLDLAPVGLNALVANLGALDVSCLGVSGNRASLIFRVPVPNAFSLAGGVISVEDNDGARQDRLDWHFVSTLPSECPVPTEVSEPIRSGDITITDAQPFPTSKEQCKHGGWRQYGFKNQGRCVASVRHRARQACIFERAAIGRPAFRAKYGKGQQHRNAMRRCVRHRING
jgi:hypothetical protein